MTTSNPAFESMSVIWRKKKKKNHVIATFTISSRANIDSLAVDSFLRRQELAFRNYQIKVSWNTAFSNRIDIPRTSART